MKVKIKYASQADGRDEEINSLEDLKKIMNIEQCRIILDESYSHGYDFDILVYDDYIE